MGQGEKEAIADAIRNPKHSKSVWSRQEALCEIQKLCTDAMCEDNFAYDEDLFKWAHQIIGMIINRCDLTDACRDIAHEAHLVIVNGDELSKTNPELVEFAKRISAIAVSGDIAMTDLIIDTDPKKTFTQKLRRVAQDMRCPLWPHERYSADQVEGLLCRFAERIEKIIQSNAGEKSSELQTER